MSDKFFLKLTYRRTMGVSQNQSHVTATRIDRVIVLGFESEVLRERAVILAEQTPHVVHLDLIDVPILADAASVDYVLKKLAEEL